MSALKTPVLASPHAQRQNDREASPNYFGFQSNTTNAFLTGSSAQHAKTNWSPPSSTVRSAAAMSPMMIPNDQRPDLDAFRRQSDNKVFNLGDLGSFGPSTTTASRAKLNRSKTSTKDIPRVTTTAANTSTTTTTTTTAADMSRHRNESMSSANLTVSQSPKRVLSPGISSLQEQARRQSPATNEPVSRQGSRTPPPAPKPVSTGPAIAHLRTESSTPSDSEFDVSLFITPQQFASILDTSDSILILDLRVSTMYNTSHISSALNLCIPTTLLKRPTFNVQRLTDTFRSDEQKARFEQWKGCEYIVVYDNSSSQQKDAAICMSTIKKFQTEGYAGNLQILKGGFLDFSRRYPSHVDVNDASSSTSDRPGSDNDGPDIIPVAGGCPMPATTNAANPFFGNIRQNMDLIGGVGTMTLQHPKRASRELERRTFPDWLRKAAEDRDAGQSVSKKFESIERREKKRMEDALSSKVAWNSDDGDDSVRIAGLEKGSKNRYNNIYPFEHSRVKLQGVQQAGCDYFNASYINPAWSYKRYISTQAPIPATFNDFWNVVWQQDIRVLVMLTAEQEGAQVKAHNYWDQRRYGQLKLDFLSETRASLDSDKIRRHRQRASTSRKSSQTSSIIAEIQDDNTGDQPFVIVRKFTLSHADHPWERMREITQLQYASWPDFGAPADPAHLVGLVRQCSSVMRSIDKASAHEPARPNQRPVLVHCSAGCGRTGTFCTVDSVIDMLKRQRRHRDKARSSSPMDLDLGEPSQQSFFAAKAEVSSSEGGTDPTGAWIKRNDIDLIEKTVEDFRLQRISMVQSLRQYVLCYESVMEWLVEQELDGELS